ncbi:WG repeat-containing protein [Paenibacillus sp. FSL R10-2796]|uniref:WG repeat-containing protein n=1 Tax=Paenibacillus sp. FSL R10-2796 TaxID=2954663 RepID=UPI0030DBA86A
MLRIRLNELGKGNDNGLIQADVWKWDGIGWNEYITQQDEDFIRTEEELFVTIPAEAGLYRVDYSNKPFEVPYLLPEWVGDDLRTTGLHPAPFNLKEGTLWGYINDEGRVQIEPRYEYAEDFQKNGLAVVQRKNSSGLIDSTGRERVKPIYSFIAPFSEERAVVSDAKGYTFIDEKGKEVTSARYDYLNSLHEGRALFSKQNTTGGQSLYGYVDAQGKEVLPAIYVDANDFMNGMALVKIKEGEYALIDPDGNILHTYNHPFVGSPGEGLLAYQATENGKYGYLNTDGSVAIQPQFTSALPFSEGRAVVNTAENYGNAYGLIDKQGKMIIPAKYYEVLQLGEGRVAIGTPVFPSQPYRGSRYVIADAETGAVLSNHTLLGVNNYQEGLASVFDAKDTYFIDRSGKKAAQPPVIPGAGTLTLSGRLIRADVDQRTSYYDRQGKQVWRQNGVIPLRPPYSVVEKKYKPNRDYLVYYPVVEGIASAEVSREVNDKLRKLSLAEDVGSGGVSQDFSYNGDFSVSFFRKNLLVLELTGYRFPFGAAHGMPTKIYPHINLRSGRFYKLGDLFKPGSRYVEKLSKIVGKQIENDPQYSYVFPDTYKGITSDQPFFVDNEALYLYFAPYEIAPYSAGFPTFRIPYAEIMGLISTEGEFWQSFH